MTPLFNAWLSFVLQDVLQDDVSLDILSYDRSPLGINDGSPGMYISDAVSSLYNSYINANNYRKMVKNGGRDNNCSILSISCCNKMHTADIKEASSHEVTCQVTRSCAGSHDHAKLHSIGMLNVTNELIMLTLKK